MDELLKKWTAATGDLKWGVQRVFHDVFALAAEGKTHLIYGADYYNGMPCLVNTVGGMLTTGGGNGIPMQYFDEVVSLFDQINGKFAEMGINTEPHLVSEVAAETLLRNFAPLSAPPEPETKEPTGTRYIEPSDEDMAKAMVSLFTADTENTGTMPDIIVDVDDDLAVGRMSLEDVNVRRTS